MNIGFKVSPRNYIDEGKGRNSMAERIRWPAANSSLRYTSRHRDEEAMRRAAMEQCLKDEELSQQLAGRSSIVSLFELIILISQAPGPAVLIIQSAESFSFPNFIL